MPDASKGPTVRKRTKSRKSTSGRPALPDGTGLVMAVSGYRAALPRMVDDEISA